MNNAEISKIRNQIVGLLKAIYQDYYPEFSEITGTNRAGETYTIFISSDYGLMVNVYAPDDEDQEWEIGGGHVDRYHECMKVTKMMMEKQADFALELA